MIAGVELIKDKAGRTNFRPESQVSRKWAELAADRGLLNRPLANDTVGISPPLVVTAEVDEMVAGLAASLDDTLDWVSETMPE